MSKDKEDWWDTHLIIDGVDKDTAKKIKERLKKKIRHEEPYKTFNTEEGSE